MNYEERTVMFACHGEELVGIVSIPATLKCKVGVLVVVGGPQYRVGSHRQFVLLCRHLAREGIACMRFDYRGMGDSSGDDRTFETVAADIGEAIDALLEQIHQLDRIVLWGLCDGASAICLYAPQDKRVAGLVLANPWVRTERGEATTYLKHYYLDRLFQLSFWRKAISGNLDALSSITALTRTVRTALTRKHKETVGHQKGELPGRMAESLRQARLPVLYLLSKRDYVAAEFEELTSADKDWNALVSGAQLERFEADHTFSTGVLREAVAGATAAWVSQVGATLANIDAKILLRATT